MDRPNVVLIMSDQHHKRAMSSAGHPYVKTPALDRLAEQGLSFRQAFCNYPLCGPSRAAFMTGQHPHENGVLTNHGEIRTDTATFAHRFYASGYETVLSGRMHFVGLDQRHGFERRLISDCPASAYIAAGWKLQDVLGDLVDTPGMAKAGLTKSGPGRSGYLAFDEAVTGATLEFFEERKSSDKERPFLLVVGYAMPHCPFVCDRDDFYIYWNALPDREVTEEGLGQQHPYHRALRRSWGALPLPDAGTFKRVEAAYYGMVNHVDRDVEQILNAIDDSGEADNTIVVYTSDHGEQLGEHGLWWKSTFYEGSIGVPLIISTPDENCAGEESQSNVSLMDIGPTLLDLAGLDPLPKASGRSFRCVLDGDEAAWHNEVFAENSGPNTAGMPQRMLKSGEWKYNYYHGMRPQLFNTAEDPLEQNDLYDNPAQAERLKAMETRVLDGWDPEVENQRHRVNIEELALIGAYHKGAAPPEPDPVWFDTPPENYIDPVE